MREFLFVDPLADKMPGLSPYNYVACNPIKLVDPDGRAPSFPPYALSTKIQSWSDKDGTFNRVEGTANTWAWSVRNESTNKSINMGRYTADPNSLSTKEFQRDIASRQLPRDWVGDGIELFSSTKLPSNGKMSLAPGSAGVTFETGDMLIPSEGDILGIAANKSNFFLKALYNMGNSATNGVDAVGEILNPEKTVRFPTDSFKNIQLGGGWYNTVDQFGQFLELKRDTNYLKEE